MAKRRGNNEGTISKRADNRWMGRYTVQTTDGPKQKAVYGKTRAEAAEKLTAAMASRDKGLVFDSENMTVGEYLDSWLSGSVRGSVRQSTYDGYEIAVRVHIKPALSAGSSSRSSPPLTSRISTKTGLPPGSLRPP